MADPLTIVGGLAASLQLVTTAGQAVLVTIQLIQDLYSVPDQLAVLLKDVNDSISQLCHSCSTGSKVFEKLSQSKLECLSRISDVLHSALLEIHNRLTPLICNDRDRRRPIRLFWKSIVSLKIEKELTQKLVRLNRLNLDLLRELGVLGLEVQLDTNGLVMANNVASSVSLLILEAKMDSLLANFQHLAIAMPRANSAVLVKASSPEEPPGQSSWEQTATLSSGPSGPAACPEQASAEVPFLREQIVPWRGHSATPSDTAAIPRPSKLSNSQLENAKLEFLLFSIRTFYTEGNFDTSPTVPKVKFWDDTDHAIYFMKISSGEARGSSKSKARGLKPLKSSTAEAPAIFQEATATIVIELLSTLSPANTATCPYVRDGVLSYLENLAREQLPHGHPISLVIRTLKNDNGNKNISFRAFTMVAERLRATSGPAHELTLLGTQRLCALLRRSSDYSEALQRAGDGICAIRALLGPGSLQERWLLREMENVYMDQRDWTNALSVCFEIVGQRHVDKLEPNPRYHDECAVYTMEDIAKTYECAGTLDSAVAWLKQARVSAGLAFGQIAAVAHIQDKLTELLEQMGKTEELEIWTTMTGVSCDD